MVSSHCHLRALHRIADRYQAGTAPWILAFSGGKDSCGLLRLTIHAIRNAIRHHRTVTVVFCDTGVENPAISGFVRQVFLDIEATATREGLPLAVRVVRPRDKDTFWVKVIGRGCPPPTNRFRWCTDKLRVNPIRDFIRSQGFLEVLTLTGVREQESEQRNRTARKYITDDNFVYRYYDAVDRRYFCPLIDYTSDDVWRVIRDSTLGDCRWRTQLEGLYGISDRQNVTNCDYLDIRTGCWTCTVIRKDKAASNMIARGFTELEPLKIFRDWLGEFRDNPLYRCQKRRNGQKGPGPITLAGRRIILNKLLKMQSEVGMTLILKEELNLIRSLWEMDEKSLSYKSVV